MTSTSLIRVSTGTRDLIAKLAAERQMSPGDLVDRAVRKLEHEQFWMQYQADYTRLKADPEAWADFQHEMRAWDVTLLDGLEDSPYDHPLEEQ